jgi:hypothetical protein
VPLPVGTAGQYLGVGTFASTGNVGWTSFVFGTQYQYSSSSNGAITATSTTPVQRMSMTTPSIPAGTYHIAMNFSVQAANPSRQIRVYSYFDNSNVAANLWTDMVCAPSVANIDMFGQCVFDQIVLTAGVHTMYMCFSVATGSTTARLMYTSLEIFRTS